MKQENKEILLRDLCARLPYGVIVNVKGFDYDYNDKLTQIYKGVGCSIQVTSNIPYDIEQVKPYLFPLSSIDDVIRGELVGIKVSVYESGIVESSPRLIDFYNKYHIDYRGLIEKGLAIDATGLNIY
jgi:hypothetical protein